MQRAALPTAWAPVLTCAAMEHNHVFFHSMCIEIVTSRHTIAAITILLLLLLLLDTGHKAKALCPVSPPQPTRGTKRGHTYLPPLRR